MTWFWLNILCAIWNALCVPNGSIPITNAIVATGNIVTAWMLYRARMS